MYRYTKEGNLGTPGQSQQKEHVQSFFEKKNNFFYKHTQAEIQLTL